MTHQHAYAKEQNTGSATRNQREERNAHTFGTTTNRGYQKKTALEQVYFVQQESEPVNGVKGTDILRSEICYDCIIVFAKVWSSPVLTAPATLARKWEARAHPSKSQKTYSAVVLRLGAARCHVQASFLPTFPSQLWLGHICNMGQKRAKRAELSTTLLSHQAGVTQIWDARKVYKTCSARRPKQK